jgi:hypothetical protein
MNVVVVVKARSALSEDLLIAMTIIIVSTSGTVFPFSANKLNVFGFFFSIPQLFCPFSAKHCK